METNTSQNTRILAALQRGERLTPLVMLYRFGCLRASGRIHDLRGAGHNIITRMVERNGKRVAEYSMNSQ